MQHHTPAPPSDCAAAVAPAPSRAAASKYSAAVPSSNASAWVQSATVPAVASIRTDIPWASTAKRSLVVSPPFGAAHRLIASYRPCVMLMRLDIAGVNHQPLQVGVVGQGVQESLPCAVFLPIAEAIVRCPVSIVRRQVAPGCASTKNSEYAIDEAAVVPGGASYFAGAAGEERFQCFPGAVGAVVSVIGGSRGYGVGWASSWALLGGAILAPNPQFNDTP